VETGRGAGMMAWVVATAGVARKGPSLESIGVAMMCGQRRGCGRPTREAPRNIARDEHPQVVCGKDTFLSL